MRSFPGIALAFFCCLACVSSGSAYAQDWPQWRGPNRDGKAVGFKVPGTWPKELALRWKVPVGDGVATPALVGDKLFVLARQGGNEIIQCLDAVTGKEVWQDKYEASAVTGPASGFSGPRSSPTVSDGKVATLGVQGTLSCLDAAAGKLAWRNQNFLGSVPKFNTASSPIITDGLCIAQLGGERNGVLIAFDLATGKEKWKSKSDSPAYGSPVLMDVGGTKVIVAATEKTIIAVALVDGKNLWQIPYTQGRYNAVTPIADGEKIIYAGPTRGITAHLLKKSGDQVASEAVWINAENSVMFNTPVVRDHLLFGISNIGSVFCIDTASGKTAWSSPIGSAAVPQARKGGAAGGQGARRGGAPGGYGSIVDAGSVLFALTPAAELVVFEPSGESYNQLASYKL